MAEIPESTAVETDLEAARAKALRDRPDLRQAHLTVEQAGVDRRTKAAEYIPDLSISFQYYSFFNVDVLPRNLAQVGLSFSWEPFDWGRRGKELARKRLAEEQARIQARDAENAVLIDVGDKFRKLGQARAQVEASRLALESARARLPVLLNRQKVQAALLKDVIGAQATLANASRDHEQALLALWAARADFQQALGE